MWYELYMVTNCLALNNVWISFMQSNKVPSSIGFRRHDNIQGTPMLAREQSNIVHKPPGNVCTRSHKCP